MNDRIKEKLALLPAKPGCYLMKNAQGEVIYVGKAIKLCNRVKSYFIGSHNYKTTKLVSQIDDFETIMTNNEKEALVLEFNLIKKYAPRYNIMFMDDKSYPYLKLTKANPPMLTVVRNTQDKKADYFGPFPDSSAAYQTKDLLNRIYPLKKCKNMPKKACLYYHIHQCLAPCINKIDPEVYDQMRSDIKSFLHGDVKKLVSDLRKEMNQASEELNFELAKEKYDLIQAIEHVTEQQKVQFKDHKNRDIFAYYVDKGFISIQGFFMHEGKVLDRDLMITPLVGEPEDIFITFIMQYYDKNPAPYEVIVPLGIDIDTVSQVLPYRFHQPVMGEKKKLLDMVSENAKKSLDEKIDSILRDETKRQKAHEQLCELLGEEIHSIEMVDNSHISGAFNCSGVVVFKEGMPSKKDYRLYKLSQYVSDMDSMKEVLYRRYYRHLIEKRPFNDLLIVDGGWQQIQAATEIIDSLQIDLKVVGLVKDDHHRTHHLMDQNGEIFEIEPNSYLFFFLTQMQDEVHRFAITYHRKLRSKAMTKSILDDIEGIGEVRKKELMRKFKTMKNLQAASLDELKTVLPDYVAENVFELLRPSTQTLEQ